MMSFITSLLAVAATISTISAAPAMEVVTRQVYNTIPVTLNFDGGSATLHVVLEYNPFPTGMNDLQSRCTETNLFVSGLDTTLVNSWSFDDVTYNCFPADADNVYIGSGFDGPFDPPRIIVGIFCGLAQNAKRDMPTTEIERRQTSGITIPVTFFNTLSSEDESLQDAPIHYTATPVLGEKYLNDYSKKHLQSLYKG